MKRYIYLLLAVVLMGCAGINAPTGHGGTGKDDSNTVYSLSNVNPSSATFGGNQYPSQLYTSLSSEQAGRDVEHGVGNFVYNGSVSTACLGAAGVGLTMTPGACIAYNAGFRGTCGVTSGDCPSGNSITFPDASTCWVAMDENTTGSNANLPSFVRVSGTHYLLDCSSLSAPVQATDSQLLMKVVTSGGSITAVTDERTTTPPAASGALANYFGPVNINGGLNNGGHASDQISGVSVNAVKNIQAFGATCSNTTISCTLNGTNAATCTGVSATDFRKGQAVHFDHAGAASTLSTPTLTSVTKYTYALNPQPAPVAHHGSDASGCTTDATTSLYTNAACSTSYSYQIVNVAQDGSWSAPSSVVTSASGPTTLSVDNYLREAWTSDTNAIGTLIYGCAGSSCTPTLISVHPSYPIGQTVGTANFWDDMGNHFGSDLELGQTLPSGSRPADFNTTISNISGTTVTFAGAAGQSGTFTMHHDSAPAVQSAIAAACPTSDINSCGTVYVPACAGKYELGEAVSLYGTLGLRIQGATPGGQGAWGSAFQWDGPTGGVIFNLNGTYSPYFENISIPGSGNTEGVAYSADNYSSSVGPGGNPQSRSRATLSKVRFNRDEVGDAGACVDLDSNGAVGNVEDSRVIDFSCDAPAAHNGHEFYVYGNSAQTDNSTIDGGVIQGNDYGIYGSFGGLDISHMDWSGVIFTWINSSEGTPVDIHDNQVNGVFAAMLLGYGSANFTRNKLETNTGPDGYVFMASDTNTVNLTSNTLLNTSSLADNIGIKSAIYSSGNRYDVALSNTNAGGAYNATPFSVPITPLVNASSTPPNLITNGDVVVNVREGFAMVPSLQIGAVAAGGSLALNGGTSGQAIIAAPSAAATPTLTVPTITGTLALTSLAGGGTNKTTGATSMWSGTSATITSSSTDYIAYGENPGISVISAQANAQNLAPFAGTLGNLTCQVTTACQAGGVAFTVEDNGSPTTLTCTCTNSTTPTCSDTTHFPTTSAGHLLDVKVVNSNAANATGVVSCGFTING